MDNAELQKLRVSPGKLVPSFRSDLLQYSVTVASSIQELKLTPITNDTGASCSVKGDGVAGRVVKLTEGSTALVEVVVTAEDGRTSKSYVVSMHRLSPDDACLSSLKVSTGVLRPDFSPEQLDYHCWLPSCVDTVTLSTNTEDPAMKVTMKDGSALGTVSLNAGHSLMEVAVSSVSGRCTTTYSVTAIRMRCPYEMIIQSTEESDGAYSCGVCGGMAHCVCRVNPTTTNDDVVYCWKCLEEVTRISKTDPLTGAMLGENWLQLDYAADKQLSSLTAICHTPYGNLEGLVTQLPANMVAARANWSQPTHQSCPDCSKKVPALLLDVHKTLCCSSTVNCAPLKFEVKVPLWQKRLINSTLPTDCESVLKIAEQYKQQFVNQLGSTGVPEGEAADIRENLMNIASCYATAVSQSSPGDSRGHVGLALTLEELFYCEDLYGIEQTESTQDVSEENEAEASSNEEEFQAICRLHGVSATATLARQLMAVDREYHQLKDSGQTHKADHVQQLYAWKSKQAVKADKGAYSSSSEGLLSRVKEKLRHAVTTNNSDHSSLLHLGRVSLLLGDTDTARSALVMAANIKPTDPDTMLYLGLALASSSSSSSHAALLLSHGLTHYLQDREQVTESPARRPTTLHSENTWRPTNTLVGQAFLQLAHLGGHRHLSTVDCLLQAARMLSDAGSLRKGSTHNQLVWILIQARAALLDISSQKKSRNASSICKQLSAIISHCQLPATPELCKLQMKVYQTGVLLEPTSTAALTHLGNGQLAQYDITGDKQWLDCAELSFRASLSVEGSSIGSVDSPTHLTQQQWWQQAMKQVPDTPSKPAATGSKISTSQAKPTAVVSKQPRGANSVAAKKTTTAGRVGTNKPVSRAAVTNQTSTASKQPNVRQPVPATSGKPSSGRGKLPTTSRSQPSGGGGGGGGGGKGVATLGNLKAGSKPEEIRKQSSQVVDKQASQHTPDHSPVQQLPSAGVPSKQGSVNIPLYQTRLGLARVLAHKANPPKECISLYREVIKMSPDVHDAYIELGDLLKKSNPMEAVDVYSSFPFSDPPSFDDAYLHGEIVQLLMGSESYDNHRLSRSMIAMGRALGLAILDKNVSVLEAKFKTNLLKQVYAGVHGKNVEDPDLQAFFKFKCWN